MTTSEYPVTGVMTLSRDLPVEAIGHALMDCAAEQAPDAAVSIDLTSNVIEIECVVTGSDVVDALANGKLVIHEICARADLPVQFVDERRPCATEWRIVDESAPMPELMPA